ncbi:hypothetical protein FQN54_006974 [Arachnomyces sp. PD_36]|nr:hypothetical protein FQN54_006974 [Arachnomyces sp. PD_36]
MTTPTATETSTPPSPHNDHVSASSRITTTQSSLLTTSLLEQCHTLLSELTTLQTRLSSTLRKPHAVETRQLKSWVKSELKALEKLDVAKDEGEEGDDGDTRERELRRLHALRSSNLPFFMAVWTVTKRSCRSLMAFGKKFYWEEEVKGRRGKGGGGGGGNEDYDEITGDLRELQVSEAGKGGTGATKKQRRNVLVDIVDENGEEWVKVSTVTESRLLFEMAKKGWEVGWDSGSDTEDDDGEGGVRTRTILQNYDSDDSEDEDHIELLKLAFDMKKAAREVRVRYRHPRIRFVLPKIVEGKVPQIDKILNEFRKAGITVECGIQGEDGQTYEVDGQPDSDAILDEVFARVLPNPYTYFTDTLNVDCTLLLALVSDVSHVKGIQTTPEHHRAIVRQIEMETKEPLVPYEIWPAMGNRALVCSNEAAIRMHDIVDTIGTDTEKTRTDLLMGKGAAKDMDRETRIQRFQELSDHQVPKDWEIPITVVDADAVINEAWKDGTLPEASRKVAEQISVLNRSVFIYGWAAGIVTLSSNRTVAKQIEALVEANRDGDEELVGPDLWLCDTARSLVGKEKGKGGGRH